VHRRADLAKPQKRQPKKASTASGPKIEIATAAPPPEANEAVKPRRRHRRQSPPVSGFLLAAGLKGEITEWQTDENGCLGRELKTPGTPTPLKGEGHPAESR
jgi:hypothetical protein